MVSERGVTVPDLGVLTAAIATPYDQAGGVDTGMLRVLIEDYARRGVEGLYCCGSSGEGLLLSADERTLVVRTAVEAAAGRIPVVAHIGALSTRDAVDLGHRARDAGASAVSMIPPIYYSYGPTAVMEHYRAVMDAVDLPMIIYNIPQFTGTEFDVHSLRALLEDPRVIGVKQTAHNMFSLEQMKAAFPNKTYINGFDEVFVSASAAGARGTIGTTVGLQVELFRAARTFLAQGDLPGAQRVQTQINRVIAELVAVDVFPAAKYLSGRSAGGVGSLGDCRRPFRPLDATQKARLDALGKELDRFLAEA